MSVSDSMPTLTHALERDIDLLLVEELIASTPFVHWFAERSCEGSGSQVVFGQWDVKHSRRRTLHRREIDIYLELFDAETDGVMHILVENKLDTNEQPDQAESYQEECRYLVEEAGVVSARCVLVCPKMYLAHNRGFAEKFDAVISYEDISAQLHARAVQVGQELRARLMHRCDLIEQAIHKHRRGYERIPYESIKGFNEKYVALCCVLAPELVPGKSMTNSGGNPHGSVSMIFDEKATFDRENFHHIPRRFAHELGKGSKDAPRTHYAAVTLSGWGVHLATLRDSFVHDLRGTPYRVKAMSPSRARPRPGLVLYAVTPPVFNKESFEEQVEAVEEGIQITDDLRKWFAGNQPLFDSWAERIAELSP